MAPDEQPYCGIELLPHATWPDGSPAPIICDAPVHGPGTLHHSSDCGTSWSWGWNGKAAAASAE